MANRRGKGRTAEAAAATFLRSLDYRIVEMNFSCSVGEIDVIAKDGEELVFVEVRSRADSRFGDALATIGPAKQRQIVRVAQAYLSRNTPQFHTARFDVIGITANKLEHIIDAFRA